MYTVTSSTQGVNTIPSYADPGTGFREQSVGSAFKRCPYCRPAQRQLTSLAALYLNTRSVEEHNIIC